MSKEKTNRSYTALTNLLTQDTIIVKASASNWKEAIEVTGEALVKTGAVEPRYIPAMMRFKEEFGPYIVIAPGIAIPHARPEDGVKRLCLCLMTLKKPVKFGSKHNDPVDLVIAFGAVDNKQHLKVLAQLAKLLSNNDDVKRIREAKRKEEILDILHKYEQV